MQVPTSTLKLYELPAEMDAIDAELEANGGELTPALEALLGEIQGTLEEKGERLLQAALNVWMREDAYRSLVGAYSSAVGACEKKYESLTGYLARTLDVLGRDTLETANFSVSIQREPYLDGPETKLYLGFERIPGSAPECRKMLERPSGDAAWFSDLVGQLRVTQAEVRVLEAEKKRVSDLHAEREVLAGEIKAQIAAYLRTVGMTRLETAYGTPRIQANPPSYRWVGDPWEMPMAWQKPPTAPVLNVKAVETGFLGEIQGRLTEAKRRGSEFTAVVPGSEAGEGNYLEFHVGTHVRIGG